MLNLLQDHRDSNHSNISALVLNNDAKIVSKGMPFFLQLKGQIHVLDQILDIKEFMLELTEERPKDEIPSARE